MAALITALDNYTPSQIGEKGHKEYGWSHSIQERILQFHFQLTRTDDAGIDKLSNDLKQLLITLKAGIETDNVVSKSVSKGYLSLLYRMIGQTRDIIDGKGECTLTYMMIYAWYEYFPVLAEFSLRCLVDLGDKNMHQYGSWKDMKYFCNYCKTQGLDSSHPLITFAIKMMNEQLRKDNHNENDDKISLVAKWIPREKSDKFGWLYQHLATNYFYQYMISATNKDQKDRAILKCKTEYRKLVSSLNRKIDTLQIKQCGKAWSSIDFDHVTSVSLSKQKKSFLNIKKNGDIRFPDNDDRNKCAENFTTHIQKAVNGETEMKGKRVGIGDFTKQALELLRNNNQTEIDLLNSQWRDNASQTGALGKMIAMVDVSGSMEGDPMNVAIALGLRIADKSLLGKRVMTFSAKPSWVNLDGVDDFVSQVEIMRNAEWGMNTNFYAAMDLILNAIIENKMQPEDVQDMLLVVLSDMQVDQADKSDTKSLYDNIQQKYAQAGIRVHGKPYKPPHIVFWNLRSTSGFPSLANQPNCSMMSGFSPALLNLFCEQGLEALQSSTPWALLERSLENERYTIMKDRLFEEIVLYI
jgi:hypothetical protein